IVNGLLGAGGGMILVPLLTGCTDLEESEVFPSSVSIILPICIVSLCLSFDTKNICWREVILYLVGSTIGGIAAGLWGKKIPNTFLHKALGILILWGGVRYLC
ncbi:MAG: sulfite exporter TauE/SafE family protein, partial [Lentisphaeria bacterium]|nr:sulfite exporter TauE/SafE family protein [Lentisphaeria bacterium]